MNFDALMDPNGPWMKAAKANSLENSEPKYKSIMGPDGQILPEYLLAAQEALKTQMLTGQVDERLKSIVLNTEGLEKFRGEALRDGPSKWADLMLEKAKLAGSTNKDNATQQGASAAADAMSSLAMRGGLGGGSAERLAANSAREAMIARQKAARDQRNEELGIQTQDETNRISQLSQLPGMEVQALQPELQKAQLWASTLQSDRDAQLKVDDANRSYQTDINKFNLGNKLTDKGAQYTSEMESWKKKMENAANERTAKATENSGK